MVSKWSPNGLASSGLGDNCQILSVSSDNCQLGHLSARTTVRPDNCKVSNCQNPMDNCQIKLSELWKNCQSYGKTVSSDSCPLKTVRSDSCLPQDCQAWQLSIDRKSSNSLVWQLLTWQLSGLTVVRADRCPSWQLSELTVVRADR